MEALEGFSLTLLALKVEEGFRKPKKVDGL